MKGGHDRLVCVFKSGDQGAQVRLFKRFRRTELFDIGTTAKGLARTVQHHGFDACVGQGLLKMQQALLAG